MGPILVGHFSFPGAGCWFSALVVYMWAQRWGRSSNRGTWGLGCCSSFGDGLMATGLKAADSLVVNAVSDSCRVHCFEAAAHSCGLDVSPSFSPFQRASAPIFLYLKIGWFCLLDSVDGVQNSRTSGHGERRALPRVPLQ